MTRDALLELTPTLLQERVRGDELEAELYSVEGAIPDSEPADPTMAVVEEILAKVGTLDGSMRSRQVLREEAQAAESHDLEKRREGLIAMGAETVCQILGLDRITAALDDEPTPEMIANPRRVADELAVESGCFSFVANSIIEAVESHVAAHASARVLHVFSDDFEYLVAFDVADLKDLLTHLGYSVESIEDWKQCDDAKPFTYIDGYEEITKTFGEWATVNGRGHFCSENY